MAALCAAGLMLLDLTGCAEPAFFVVTEVAPRAVNGKGLAEDGADAVTGKDCRVIEGTVRKDRKYCETRGSPETRKDFKGFMGGSQKQAKRTRQAPSAAPPQQPAALP